jgi:hypothetical protein
MVYLFVLNATFSNISAISWQPVLVVEEAGAPERTTNHGEIYESLIGPDRDSNLRSNTLEASTLTVTPQGPGGSMS